MCTSKLLYMFDEALTRILFSGIFFIRLRVVPTSCCLGERAPPRYRYCGGVGNSCTCLLLSGRESSPRLQILRGVGNSCTYLLLSGRESSPRVQILRGVGNSCTYLLLSGRESSPRLQILRGVGKSKSSSPSSTASSQARYCSFRGSRLKLNRTLNVSLFIKPVTRLKWKQRKGHYFLQNNVQILYTGKCFTLPYFPSLNFTPNHFKL